MKHQVNCFVIVFVFFALTGCSLEKASPKLLKFKEHRIHGVVNFKKLVDHMKLGDSFISTIKSLPNKSATKDFLTYIKKYESLEFNRSIYHSECETVENVKYQVALIRMTKFQYSSFYKTEKQRNSSHFWEIGQRPILVLINLASKKAYFKVFKGFLNSSDYDSVEFKLKILSMLEEIKTNTLAKFKAPREFNEMYYLKMEERDGQPEPLYLDN